MGAPGKAGILAGGVFFPFFFHSLLLASDRFAYRPQLSPLSPLHPLRALFFRRFRAYRMLIGVCAFQWYA